jgi:hypothetical protein
MELDHIILEKICLHKYNKDVDQPVLINLRDWQVFNSEANWYAVCFFTVGIGRTIVCQVVFTDEYMRELREYKLKQLGIDKQI